MKEFFAGISAGQVTFWIAVAGFVMSCATWVKDIITQRVNMSVHIIQLNTHPQTTVAYAYLAIVNKSRLPLTIADIAICFPSGLTSCTARPTLVSEHVRRRGKEVIAQRFEYSTALPIQIPGLGGLTVLALFEDLPQNIPPDATDLNLVIYTNRGKPKKMKLGLPQDWAYQKTI